MKKVIIFDLDDTLINSSLAYKKALKKIGISMNKKPYQNARASTKAHLPKNHVSARNRFIYFKTMLENQKKLKPKDLLKKMDTYETALHKNIKNQWKKLKRDQLMKKLSKTYRLGILSNENTRTQMIKINAIDPHGKYFRSIVTSEEVGVEKPNKHMFKTILKRVKAPAQKCWYIGDNFKADILPAKSLGFNVIWTSEFAPLKGSKNNKNIVKIKNLNDIAAIL